MRPYYEADRITIYHADWRTLGFSANAFSLVLTDPPYGDDHDTDYTRFTGGASASCGSHSPVHGDDEPFDPRPLIPLAKQVILFGGNRFSNRLPVGSWLIWNKRTPYGGKNVMSDAEVAWWSHGRGVYIFDHMWDGFNRASERGTAYHPTQKPVAVMEWCLLKSQSPGPVLDPFCGSGPVGVAAKGLGLSATLCDVREAYCEIAAERLSQGVLDFGGVA